MKFQILASLHLLVAVSGSSIQSLSRRISGGKEATPFEHDFFVGIFDSNNEIVCGGTLYRSDIVITAKSCLWKPFDENIKVVAHRHDLSKTQKQEQSKELKVLGYFDNAIELDGSDMHYPGDIAVLKIEDSNLVTKTVKLASNDNLYKPGVLMNITGWGRNFLEYPKVLQEITLPVSREIGCASMIEFDEISDFCVGQLNVVGRIGMHDAGDPIFQVSSKNEVTLAGVVSHVSSCLGCDDPKKISNRLTIATNVKYNKKWIKEAIHKLDTTQEYTVESHKKNYATLV